MRILNITAFLSVLLLAASSPAWAEAPAAGSPTPAAVESLLAKDDGVKTTKRFPDVVFALSDADKAKMDIPPAMYADFWKKWHFVGARWRQDIREFRLTYANDLAWNTLIEQRTDYPVGAMFGKLVYPAEEDLALPSSVMPSRFLNRLMVMLWDPKNKHTSADGWTYLRFINPDPRAPQDPASTGIWGVMSDAEIKACVECHARAADRGSVFSQPQFLFSESKETPAIKDKKVLANRFNESMKDLDPKKVPRIALSLIESLPEWKGRALKGYEGDFFAGALGEMGPVLAKIAQKDTGSVFLIYDRTDPDTLELASSLQKKGYENCVGLVRLRGSALNFVKEQGAKKRKLEQNGDAAYPVAEDDGDSLIKKGPNGVMIRDVSKEYKPSAMLYITCGVDGISRQRLPLLYSVKDKDGLPSYRFAPAVIE